MNENVDRMLDEAWSLYEKRQKQGKQGSYPHKPLGEMNREEFEEYRNQHGRDVREEKMIEVNPQNDWADNQIDEAVEEFSDWAAGEESALSVSMAEHYLWVHDGLSEAAQAAILDYARDFGAS